MSGNLARHAVTREVTPNQERRRRTEELRGTQSAIDHQVGAMRDELARLNHLVEDVERDRGTVEGADAIRLDEGTLVRASVNGRSGAVSVGVRPEKITIGAGGGANELPGTVVEIAACDSG